MFNAYRFPRRLSVYRPSRWTRVIAWLAVGLGPFVLAQAHTQSVHPVIELAGLKAKLARHIPNLLLVDVRQHAAYLRGHIPGAINLPAARTLNHGNQGGIVPLQQVGRILRHAGIRHADYLVLYDNGLLKDAAHVFWVLESYGHKQVSVLDGGFSGWVADHGVISQQVTTLAPSHYVPNLTAHHLATELATLIAARGHRVQIIDARSHRAFLGLVSRAKRKGHIINAINVPWTDNLAQRKPYPRLKSRKALRALYGMLHPGEHVIAYCNRSMESAVTYLVLRQLGYPVSIYDGAWQAWGNDDDLPIATGPARREFAHAQ